MPKNDLRKGGPTTPHLTGSLVWKATYPAKQMISTTLSIYLSIYLSIELLDGRPNHCFFSKGCPTFATSRERSSQIWSNPSWKHRKSRDIIPSQNTSKIVQKWLSEGRKNVLRAERCTMQIWNPQKSEKPAKWLEMKPSKFTKIAKKT